MSLHRYAIFAVPAVFGQALQFLGFVQDEPDAAELKDNAHCILELEQELANELAAAYSPGQQAQLQNTPMAIIIEGSLWTTGVRAYGPFLSAAEARQHGYKLQCIEKSMILALDDPQRELYRQRGIDLERLQRESQDYHKVMHHLKDTERGHGRCLPREDLACSHCNAKDAIVAMTNAYRGPRVICS
jgi:hypothetical protein